LVMAMAVVTIVAVAVVGPCDVGDAGVSKVMRCTNEAWERLMKDRSLVVMAACVVGVVLGGVRHNQTWRVDD